LAVKELSNFYLEFLNQDWTATISRVGNAHPTTN
jgi:hypothetical protein